MIQRRDFFGITLGAGVSMVLPPDLLRAVARQQARALLQRAIPSSGELLPVIGLSRGNDARGHAAFKEVLRTYVDSGGRVLDMVHGWAQAEEVTGAAAAELGAGDKMFWSTLVRFPPEPPPATKEAAKIDPAAVRSYIEASFERLKVPRIDLLMVNTFRDTPALLGVLRELKREGRIRYIGVTGAFANQHAAVEAVMRTEPIDFIGVDYALDNRGVEQTLLPLALERKIGVIACFPFGGNIGPDQKVSSRLFRRVGKLPLPDWAAEFDATSWGQFFLKYIVSHPAVTVVRAGTTQPRHLLDNFGGGTGRLPSEATRRRMAAFVDALPPLADGLQAQVPGVVLAAEVLDRYVGEYQAGSGAPIVLRRDGTTLLAKPGGMPEMPLTALSETRFADPRGPILEVQMDAEGAVTGLVVEQGGQRTTLARK
ncbi:MAG: aldo/keto reductase [Planctomycetes bacterium]|nr:aldo/keto reductase [Planctomycetota bacterium]